MKRLFVLLACLLAVPAQGQILSIIMGGKTVAPGLNTTQIIAGGQTNVMPSNAATSWCPILSNNSNNQCGGTSANVSAAWPTGGTLLGFGLEVIGTPGASASWTVCLNKNNSACLSDSTITVNASTCTTNPCFLSVTMSDATANAATDPTQLYNIEFVPSGSPGGAAYSLYLLWQPTVEGETVLFSSTPASVSFICWSGGCGGTTQSQTQISIPVAGTLTRIVGVAQTDPGVGNTRVATTDKNLSGQSQTFTFAHSALAQQDNTHPVTLAAGDTIDLGLATGTGSPTDSVMSFGAVFVPTITGQFIIPAARITASLAGSTLYFSASGRTGVPIATEGDFQNVVPAFTVNAVSAYVATAPGSGKNYVFNFRDCSNISTCSSASGVTGTLADTNTTFVTGSLSYAITAGHFIDWQSVPTGSPTAQGSLAISVGGYIAPY